MKRWFHTPTASAVLAGALGAGLLDVLLALGKAGAEAAWELAALGLGLYGCAGVLAGACAGWAAGTALGRFPGGARAALADDATDRRTAATLLAAAAGAAALGAGAGAVQGLFAGNLASRRLAVIATAGLVLALCPVAVLLALSVRSLAAALVGHLPRPARFPRTGLLLIALATAGLLAGLAALLSTDWRVLDLGPLGAAGLAAALALAHALFWGLSPPGQGLAARLPLRPMRACAVALGPLLALAASRVPESSPAYQASTEASLGLRFALRVARALTDRDRDGYSARFGGGDCHDGRADVFPGAEDIPGDGVDQNCQGGDAAHAPGAGEGTFSPPSPTPPSAGPPRAGAFDGNILIVTIDSLRADRLGVAGYGRPPGTSLTPTLDALARRGAYFRRVWAQAPNTPRSFPSIVTSRYPSEIAWEKRSLNYSPILPSNQTFFEHLARAGLEPIGVFSHFYFTRERGLAKGFAEWSNDGAGSIAESNRDVAAPRIVSRVVDRLRRAAVSGRRFVLWTHLFEPHSSYLPHPEFPTRERGLAGLEEKYDFEIAFVDRWVGKIITALDETGLARRTAIVVFADHGEAWGEHKHYFHGQDLSEEQLRVPLIVAVPGRTPIVADDAAALIDVGPTLLDLVGTAPPASFRGRSLLPRIEGAGPLPARPIFAELLTSTAWPKHEVMMVDGATKITHRVSERRWEMYDLGADSKQQRNLADHPVHRPIFDALHTRLLAFEEGHR